MSKNDNSNLDNVNLDKEISDNVVKNGVNFLWNVNGSHNPIVNGKEYLFEVKNRLYTVSKKDFKALSESQYFLDSIILCK